MHLKFQVKYKSIEGLPIEELPDFAIITGKNGSGKTHFLEAIKNGALAVKGINQEEIKYYNWGSLFTPDKQPVQPRQLEGNRNVICKGIADFCAAHFDSLMYFVNIQQSGPIGLM